MEVLRNLFGNVTAGIIRLLVTLGILAGVYFFVVRPALDTTEKISHEVNGNIQQSLKEAHIGKTLDSVNRQVQREIKKSIRHAPSHCAWPCSRSPGAIPTHCRRASGRRSRWR